MFKFRVVTVGVMIWTTLAARGWGLEEASIRPPDTILADGSPIIVADKEISITPPVGWEVMTRVPNMTLVMQPPLLSGERYRRTLQVSTFKGSRYIDEDAAEEVGEFIISSFSKLSTSVENYRLRNYLPVRLPDGNHGLLYYTEFTLEGVAMMHAHLMLSGQNFHYLLTFTDVAENFESSVGASEFLSIAWESMISARVPKLPPQRWTKGELAAVLGVSTLLAGFFVWLRSYRARRIQRSYDDQAEALEKAAEADTPAEESWKLATGTAGIHLTGPGIAKSDIRTIGEDYAESGEEFADEDDDRMAS